MKTAEDKQEEIEQVSSEVDEQLEMVPLTKVEAAEKFVEYFQEEVERRAKALIGAREKLAEAKKLREIAEKSFAQAIEEDAAARV